MSVGKVIAAAVSGTIENTQTLANFNLDFSLVRVEAPSEYKDVGLSLSPSRSKEAEQGLSHITARKLGALFKNAIPDTPNLFHAYGLRASEIVKSPKYNPKGTKADGIFADKIGADGTTIWAAATSGHAAIAMHLLACMLARIWPGPEAVSIWVELVSERRRALSALDNGDPLNMSAVAASSVTLTRDQLAKWDASARAWLLTGDQAKEASQKQLLLIINNLGIPVGANSTVYESVIQVWTSAMIFVDRLTMGIPQSVEEGGALLGLSSWHLYPDLLVLKNGAKRVEQNDQLIASGGLVTLGLKSIRCSDQGIFWSLPLAHLRFYGDPAIVEGSFSSHTSGISPEQLRLVALGTLLNTWRKDLASFPSAAEVLQLIWHNVKRGDTAFDVPINSSWLCMLATAAQDLLSSTGTTRLECLQLAKTGRRRYQGFLNDHNLHSSPFFGLANPTVLLGLIDEEEDRIRFLRRVAQDFTGNRKRLLIQYKHVWVGFGHASYECASVPWPKTTFSGKKRNCDGSEVSHLQPGIRWLETEAAPTLNERVEQLSQIGEKVLLLGKNQFIPCFQSKSECHRVSACSKSGSWGACFQYAPGIIWPDAPFMFSSYNGLCQQRDPQGCLNVAETRSIELQLLFGDPNVAALYAMDEQDTLEPIESVPISHLKWILEQDIIHPLELVKHLASGSSSETQPTMQVASLQALATTMDIYKSLPGARVAMKVASETLGLAKWIPDRWGRQENGPSRFPWLNKLLPYELNLEQTISCILMFESGSFNLDPSSLGPVMAISSGNSLYIPNRLLCDPSHEKQPGKVTRVIGNLGRPGIALLVPPRNPRMRKLDDSCWTCINHEEFDGVPADSFQHTTLHLSFSDWMMPIDVGVHGLRDSHVYFLEAVVSIHDRGEWIADINILEALSSRKLKMLPHGDHKAGHINCDQSKATHIVSVDCWEELLEHPVEPCVVRASGNWQARLAACSLAVQRGHATRLVSGPVCWKCILSEQETAENRLTTDEMGAPQTDGGSSEEDDPWDSWEEGYDEGHNYEDNTNNPWEEEDGPKLLNPPATVYIM